MLYYAGPWSFPPEMEGSLQAGPPLISLTLHSSVSLKPSFGHSSVSRCPSAPHFLQSSPTHHSQQLQLLVRCVPSFLITALSPVYSSVKGIGLHCDIVLVLEECHCESYAPLSESYYFFSEMSFCPCQSLITLSCPVLRPPYSRSIPNTLVRTHH